MMNRYLVNRSLALIVCLGLGSAVLFAVNNKEQDRLENCGVVMQEILDVPDNIPQELLEKAECVIVSPSMTKVAMGIGGSYGRGAMVCRSGPAFNGPCSVRPDDEAARQVYGRKMNARNIVTGKRIAVPASGRHLVDVLTKNAPYNESKQTSNR